MLTGQILLLMAAGSVRLSVGGAATAGQAAVDTKGPAQKDADQQAVVGGNNRFALELYGKLGGQRGNLFCSPYSVSTALAMTYAGARGETAGQMAKVLHFALEPERLHAVLAALIADLNAAGKKGDYQLSVANALWGQKGVGFLKAFLDLANTKYGAGLNEVDFAGATEAARQTINAWIERQTQDKIKELIKQGILGADTRLVLTNAIYFKGNWAARFKEQETKEEPFNLSGGSKVNVPMMHQTLKPGYMEGEGFQAIEMSYAGDRLSMVVFLPAKLDGLADFEGQLDADHLAKWLPELRQQEVIVALPKFKMTCEFRLDDALKSMGMTEAFSASADFSGMTGKKDLNIAAVLHKAFVDVNEQGTEAAAATAVVMKVTSVMPSKPPPVFRADHPFVFLIRDVRSGSILFIGRMADPKGA